MAVVIQIIEGSDGMPTPLDGEYLVEYDPCRDGLDRRGNVLTAHIRTSKDLRDAKVFDSLIDAYGYAGQVDKRAPFRADGGINRPLTFFTISMVSMYDV